MSKATEIVKAVDDEQIEIALRLVFLANEPDLEIVVQEVDPTDGPLAKIIHSIASSLLSAKRERRKRKEAEEKLAQLEQELSDLRARLERAELAAKLHRSQDDHDYDGGSNGPR